MEESNIQQQDINQLTPYSPVPQKPKNPLIFIMFSIAIIIIIGAGGYLVAARKTQPIIPTTAPKRTSTSNLTPFPTTTIPSTLGITYTNAILGATFQYPSTWKITYNDWQPGSQKGDSYDIELQDTTPLRGSDSIFIAQVNNPKNYTLAQFYQNNFPGGMQRYANISFETHTNPNGISFQRLVLPYKNNDSSYRLEIIHNNKFYSITRNFGPPTKQFQAAYERFNNAFNQIVNSFKFKN